MRSDEEFIMDVMRKANSEKARKRKRENILIKCSASVCALAVVVCAVFFAGPSADTQPVINAVTEDNREYVKGFSLVADCAYAPSEEIKSTEMSSEVVLPSGGLLDVRDTSSMSENEISALSYELKTELKKLYGENIDWHITGNSDSNVSVLFATADKLRFALPENTDAKEIIISCTENGNIMLYDDTKLMTKEFTDSIRSGNNIVLTADEYKNVYGKDNGIFINWQPSEKLIEKLSADPETDLSGISDGITVKVCYEDGTSESLNVGMLFDSKGVLHNICTTNAR